MKQEDSMGVSHTPLQQQQLDAIRLRLGNGDSCIRVEAARLGITTAELKRALYPHYQVPA